jgi:hypothetical protein
MIGYRVTARNAKFKYLRKYDGWSEGNPRLESKIKEIAAKQIAKMIMKKGAELVVKGVSPVLTVADIVTKPLQGLGTAAGQLIAENLMKINRARAEQGLIVSDIEVTIAGDFDAVYLIKDSKDLTELPNLLGFLIENGTTNQFMGESVLEAVFMAHINFARHVYNSGDWNVTSQTLYQLEIEIKL